MGEIDQISLTAPSGHPYAPSPTPPPCTDDVECGCWRAGGCAMDPPTPSPSSPSSSRLFVDLYLPAWDKTITRDEKQQLNMGEKKKAGAILVRLVSAAGTGFFYVVKKTKRLQSSNIKLEFRKYDPRVNRHVLFTEAKMK
ncbi:hypothetical protein OROGR_008869 [Orobanche gracilis]